MARSVQTMIRSEWRPGPQEAWTGQVFVSVTDFTSSRVLDLPGIAWAGYGLRRGWATLDGAVGMWLWAKPTERRTGSVSVWTSAPALSGFVRWAPHVRIMKRYRTRGRITAHSWHADEFDRCLIWRAAVERLSTHSAGAGHGPGDQFGEVVESNHEHGTQCANRRCECRYRGIDRHRNG